MATYNLTFAGYKGEKSIHAAAARHFGERLTALLGDDINYNLLSDAISQGPGFENPSEVVAAGNLDLCYMATIRFAKYVPEFVFFDLPYLTDDRATLFTLLRGELGDFFKTELERTSPLKILAFWDNGLRQVSNRVRPITSLADCEGIAIRTQVSDVIGDSVRAMGFTAKPLDIKIYRKDLDRADIQAQDNDLPTIFNFAIHHHHPYITLTGHILGMQMVICSQKAMPIPSQNSKPRARP